jgi:hypothetical protein
LDWIAPSGGSVELAHVPTPQISSPDGAAVKPDVSAPATSAKPDTTTAPATPAKLSKKTRTKAGLKTVSGPSLAEEMSDQIPF